jgi:hypothetical protein
MNDRKSLLKSYCLLRQHNRSLDSEGVYSTGVTVLGRALMSEYGIDVHRVDAVREALKR